MPVQAAPNLCECGANRLEVRAWDPNACAQPHERGSLGSNGTPYTLSSVHSLVESL